MKIACSPSVACTSSPLSDTCAERQFRLPPAMAYDQDLHFTHAKKAVAG